MTLRDLRETARAFHDAGICVLPAAADGTKRPGVDWKTYQTCRPDDVKHQELFEPAALDGIGAVCGNVSGGLEMLEIEGRATHLLDTITAAAKSAGVGDVWARVTNGYVEVSPSGGVHWLYRVPGSAAPNTKLARQNDEHGTVLIETRGEGGWTILAPSGGRTHPTGKPWQLILGSPSNIPELTPAERDSLHELLRTFDEYRPRSGSSTSSTPGRVDPFKTREPAAPGQISPGDDYASRTSWADILAPHGWRQLWTHNGRTYWRRPGKEHGISATTGGADDGVERLWVFSTSAAPFETERPYSKLGAYTELYHGGDYQAAARELSATGYGSRPPDPFVAAVGPAQPAANPDEPPQRERTSWWPRDLAAVISGKETEPPPAYLARDDGRRLFYAGKVNGLLGESESGKTWVALEAVRQALASGESVGYFDFEDTARGIVSRLVSLGVEAPMLQNLTYVSPEEPLGPVAAADLRETLDERAPQLIIVDGVNAAMTLFGLKLEDNADATKFAQQLLVPLSRTGAAVVTIDHLPKNKENRGKGGIGAQAKRAMTTGAAYVVEVIKPFGRGVDGMVRLAVDKDRPGHVREFATAAGNAAIVKLASVVDPADPFGGTAVRIAVEAPKALQPAQTAATGPDKATQARRSAIWSFVQQHGSEPVSKNAIWAGVGGRKTAVLEAVDHLATAGYLTENLEGYVAGFVYRVNDETADE